MLDTVILFFIVSMLLMSMSMALNTFVKVVTQQNMRLAQMNERAYEAYTINDFQFILQE